MDYSKLTVNQWSLPPMRFFSDFCAYVNETDWNFLILGDPDERREARGKISSKLDKVELYHHSGPNIPNTIGVTLADLICHGVIRRVTLHKD